MGKLYTLDEKLLTETPEIRIGEKIYPVDDREKTVKKVIKSESGQGTDPEAIDEILAIALGKGAFKEISALNMPFPAYMQLFQMVVGAMTGEESEDVGRRFPERDK